jgi:nicotinate phosphoribosyltransferase
MMAHESHALLTDLYQLTMAQAYFNNRKMDRATFSLFIRSYPLNRGFFVSAGLHDILKFLENFAFDGPALDYLSRQNLFTDDFLEFLEKLGFTGDVWALPEGHVFFKDEPILEVSAPIIEAQLMETFIINQINLQSLIATKAARCVLAAGKRAVVDFALRRTHGIDAGMKVARSSYLAGFAGSSNVLAGKRYAIPTVGTMAHSFVTSFDDETDAFRSYAASFPESATLLIDTYDTIAGARKAVEVAKEMAARGQRLKGVRIDSGDLAELGIKVRKIFDDAGFSEVRIIGSGGLDEYDLSELSAAEIPFDSYGVGTKMGTSSDAPWSDMAYKLVEYGDKPVLKKSPGKISWPGAKQVFRQRNNQGQLEKDIIGLRDERITGTEALLRKVMKDGKIVVTLPTLAESRAGLAKELGHLPDLTKAIRNPVLYRVEFSPALLQLREETERKRKLIDT